MCHERKWAINCAEYGGPIKLFTVTALGQDLLAWSDHETIWISEAEPAYPLVEYVPRTVYNATAQARMSRLMEAAQKAADRFVRRQWGGELPRQIGNVRAAQKRGVWHFHYSLPMGSEVERTWSRTVERFIRKALQRESERWTVDERWEFLVTEYMTSGREQVEGTGEWVDGSYVGATTEPRKPTIQRGFYGFGFVNARNPAGRSVRSTARYQARNAAGYMARNVAGSNRSYVSSRLTRRTGATMRALRAVNWLYVRRKLVAAGELWDDPVPGHWAPEWAARVVGVEGLCKVGRAPPA